MLNATYAEILDRVDIPLTFLYRSQAALQTAQQSPVAGHTPAPEPVSDIAAEQSAQTETTPAQDSAAEIPDNLLLWPGTAQVREQAQQSYSSIGQLLSLRPATPAINGLSLSATANAQGETPVTLPLATEAEVLAVVNALAEMHEGLPDPLLSVIETELQQQEKQDPSSLGCSVKALGRPDA